MSTTLHVRFISGRVHATPWGASHNEGRVEFPPSPWRLTRAMIATWLERAPELDAAVARRMLNQLAIARPTYYIPRFSGAHVRHYLPESAHKAGVSTATAKVLDAFAAVDPAIPLVVQWAIDLPPDERHALGEIADRMPHLGRAESLVQARLLEPGDADGIGEHHRLLEPRPPEASDQTVLRLIASQGQLDWDAALLVPWKLRQKGYLDPPSTETVLYAGSEPLEWAVEQKLSPAPKAGITAIEWKVRGRGRIPITAAVAYGDVLRQAIIRHADRVGATLDWRMLGKDEAGTSNRNHQHAHFLPVADEQNNNFMRGLLLWVPAGLTSDAIAAATSVQRLWAGGPSGAARSGMRDFRSVQLFTQRIGNPSDWEACPPASKARRWNTLTPYAPARHLRADRRWEKSLRTEVARELMARGFPEPTAVLAPALRSDAVSYEQGATNPLEFRRHRANGRERLRDARTAFHVQIEFEREVCGPIAIGALSHFGLGVFTPYTD